MTASAAKTEGDTVKEESKTDVTMTSKSKKAENEASTSEPDSNPNKTESSALADAADDNQQSKSKDSLDDSVTNGNENKNKVEKETDTSTEEMNNVKMETQSDPEDESDSGSESSATTDDEENSSEEKSIVTNNWDNSYSTGLKEMYADVDPDTRAVAEEMIRAAQSMGALKSQPTTKNETQKDIAPKDSQSTSNDLKSTGKLAVSSKRKSGNEPSALELALKQQGISQSDQLRSTQFPFRLHNMLDDAEKSGHADIVSWCPGGDSFKIHKPQKLIGVLQKYFRQSKFKSFLRQLQGYNFKRITRGQDQGVVSHPLFLRGRRSVSTLMRRKRVMPKGGSAEVTKTATQLHLASTKRDAIGNDAISIHSPSNTRILPKHVNPIQSQHPLPHQVQSAMLKPPMFLHKGPLAASQAPIAAGLITPNPQDVLCVDHQNSQQVQQFQGNRKLASIIQKITGHYASANESVRTMIVNEISSRIQNSGSRFLKLSKDGLSWMECNREDIFRKGTHSCDFYFIRDGIDSNDYISYGIALLECFLIFLFA